jgi:3-hydroxybutyryl-CoA dehydrogenase
LNLAIGLARRCGKDPSILKRDVRGFLSNRMLYAAMREAIYLLENDYADVESIDAAFRNDIGWYALIAGPFRLMDLTGMQAYVEVIKDLYPELANTTELPETMKRMEVEGANGVFNNKGFYNYTPEEAKQWEKTWAEYSWECRRLADKYTPLD